MHQPLRQTPEGEHSAAETLPNKQSRTSINHTHQDMHVSWLQVNEHRTQS